MNETFDLIKNQIDAEFKLISKLDNEVKASKEQNNKIKADLAEEEAKDHDLK